MINFADPLGLSLGLEAPFMTVVGMTLLFFPLALAMHKVSPCCWA